MLALPQSYYGQKFSFESQTYLGPDFSKKAFIFPGQGAAVPGMFAEALERQSEFIEAFTLADIFAAKYGLSPVSNYVNRKSPIPNQDLPFVRNLALFCCEVASFRFLCRIGLSPNVIMGHSFGEYAALHCAGIVGFDDMLEIVYRRDFFSPELNSQGTLFALGLSKEEVEKLEIPGAWSFANYNSPKQTVISLGKENLKQINDFLRKKRVPMRDLDSVARPYHSDLMLETRTKLFAWLESKAITPQPCQIHLVSSVNAQIIEAGTILSSRQLNQLMAEQLTTPVDFIRQAQCLKNFEIRQLIELCPGTTFIGFIKSSLNDYATEGQSVVSLLSATKSASKMTSVFTNQDKASPFFKIISGLIRDVTGYDLKHIEITDSFQEDLHIDSIKKAEIIMRTMEMTGIDLSENINLSQLQQVGSVVRLLEQKKLEAKSKPKPQGTENAQFLSLQKHWVEQRSLQIQTKEFLHFDFHIRQNLDFDLSSVDQKISKLQNRSEIHFVFHFEKESALPEIQWLTKFLLGWKELENITSKFEKTYLFLVGRSESPLQEGLFAFFKSIQKETQGFVVKSILNRDEISTPQVLEQETNASSGTEVKYENGKRWLASFLPQASNSAARLSNKNIFSVGGTRGILFEMFLRMKLSDRNKLFLVGRSAEDSLQVKNAIKRLRKNFTEVIYQQCDATSLESLSKAISKASAKFEKIDLIFNASGIEKSEKHSAKNTLAVEQELVSKFVPLENIAVLMKSMPSPEKIKVVNFSSVVSEFGNDGQAVYSFSNRYLSSRYPFVHLHWPAMDGIGMTEQKGLLQKIRSSGVSLLDAKKAFPLFLNAIESDSTSVGNYYFLPMKDLFLYDFLLRDIQSISKCLGEIIVNESIGFRRVFDSRKEPYFLDHAIESVSVVPAAFSLAAYLTFGNLLYRFFPVLKDISISNMILVQEKESACFTQLQFNDFGEVNAKIVSNLEQSSCRILPQSSPRSNLKIEAFAPQFRVKMDTFYSIRSIDYGPKFQVASKIEKSKDGLVRVTGLQKAPVLTGNSFFDYLCFILELAFQSVSAKNTFEGRGLGIPVRIQEIKPHQLYCADKPQVIPRIDQVKSNAEQTFGDAFVYDQNGELVLEVLGIELATIRNWQSLPFDIEDVKGANV